jgi:twitching motility protein PilU
MEQSLSPGSQTFEQALHSLYTQNVISLEEALGNADSATNLSWLINNSKGGSAGGQRKAVASGDLSTIRLNI